MPVSPSRDSHVCVGINYVTLVQAWPHPASDKLWCEEIDIGEVSE